MKSFTALIQQTFRRLRRAPTFTLITLITLAAGVGANTVVFSVLEGVLLKPLPYPQPRELVGISHTAPGINLKQLSSSPSNYFIYREQNHTFQDIALYQGDAVSVTGLAEPERVQAFDVTAGLLPILGISPLLGRPFSPQDDSPGAPDTVILTYGYWRSKFAGDPSVIGRTLTVDGKPRTIIGVMPQRFQFLDHPNLALFLPLQLDRDKTKLGNFSFQSLARLQPGVTLEQANADVARMLPVVLRSFPTPLGFSIKLFEDARIGPDVHPLKQDVVGDVGGVLWLLMGSIAMVLLIACANVANLLLVRVEGRRQEFAVRSALGATRVRIAGELLLESILLGLLGCALGLAIAFGALRVLLALAPDLPRLHEVSIDGPVLLFSLLISLLASLLVALIPILKSSGSRLNTGLRQGGRALSQSREQHRARNVLVVVQVALALVLLICSGLMIRTFRALAHVNPGFYGPGQVQTFRISISDAQVPKPEDVTRMEQAIVQKIQAVPGVISASLGTGIPMDSNNSFDPVFARDKTYGEGQLPPLRRFKYVAPGYLSTIGIPLLYGRGFTWDDVYQKIPVALVSENFAREYWNDPTNAIGKQIRVGAADDWRQIIGVVANVYDDGVSKKPSSCVYWPILTARLEGQELSSKREVAFAVRSPRAGSQSFLGELRSAVWSVDPSLPLSSEHTAEYFYKQSLARTSFTLIMLGVAGAMALLLGVIGIYGVIAYSVSQRTREIGIRMALGAQRQSLTGMFVRHGLLLTGIGVACGLIAAALLMRLMSGLLFNVRPVDPFTYVAVSLGLVATAFLASYLPSRRASAVDPVEALRAE